MTMGWWRVTEWLTMQMLEATQIFFHQFSHDKSKYCFVINVFNSGAEAKQRRTQYLNSRRTEKHFSPPACDTHLQTRWPCSSASSFHHVRSASKINHCRRRGRVNEDVAVEAHSSPPLRLLSICLIYLFFLVFFFSNLLVCRPGVC